MESPFFKNWGPSNEFLKPITIMKDIRLMGSARARTPELSGLPVTSGVKIC